MYFNFNTVVKILLMESLAPPFQRWQKKMKATSPEYLSQK